MTSRRAATLRALFGVLVLLVFVGCLIGILITGPIVVTQTHLELELDVSGLIESLTELMEE